MRDLTITVNPDWKGELRTAGKRAIAGLETGIYQGETLNFASSRMLFSRLGEKQWEIITTLLERGPLTDFSLAEAITIDEGKLVAETISLLELGVIERDVAGHLFCPFDAVAVKLVLRRSDSKST